MLDQLDLSRRLSKSECKTLLGPLRLRMAELGRAVHDSQTPVIIVFEGWSNAGRGDAIAELTLCLDPRGYRVYSIVEPTEEEQQFPWVQRFFLRTAARGEIAIFHGSWYRHVLFDRVSRAVSQQEWQRIFTDIRAFERMLAEDGTLIIKLWLHLDRREQRRRIKELLKHPATAWRVRDDELLQQKKYDKYVLAAEDMFGQTEAEFAPWALIPAIDRAWMKVRVFEMIVARLNGLPAQSEMSLEQVESCATEVQDPSDFVPKTVDTPKPR